MKNQEQIPDKAIKYIDKTSFDLVEIMEVNHTSVNRKDEPIASVREMSKLVLLDSIGDIVECQGHLIRVLRAGKAIGFTHQTGVKFSGFIRNIYKINQINTKVSESFVKDLALNWLVDTKERGQAKSDFSAHLLTAIDEAVVEYKIYYHVVCLFLNKPFAIGNVEFGFFTREYFEYFKEKGKTGNPEKDKSSDELWDKYPGRCYAMAHVKAENEKAKEIAFLDCGRAIDVLKICSPTLDWPEFECAFEIDRRLTRNTETEILVEEINENREISLTLHGPGQPFSLTDNEMAKFKIRGLEIFDRFLREIESGQSELQKMILIAIQRLASSFTNKDLHQRVADICSILESLLLLNDSGSMSDMVCKYFCRLVHSEPDKRKELDKIYKEFYGIRSSWVHHAKRNPIDLPKLAYLQQCAQLLLQVLISKGKTHTVKETILSEIDDALYRA